MSDEKTPDKTPLEEMSTSYSRTKGASTLAEVGELVAWVRYTGCRWKWSVISINVILSFGFDVSQTACEERCIEFINAEKIAYECECHKLDEGRGGHWLDAYGITASAQMKRWKSGYRRGTHHPTCVKFYDRKVAMRSNDKI